MKSVRIWSSFSTLWLHNIYFLPQSTLIFGFEQISWLLFNNSAFSFSPIRPSTYYAFFTVMGSSPRIYHCKSDRAFVSSQNFVMWTWMRDDLTNFHPSNFGMHLELAPYFGFPLSKNALHNGEILVSLQLRACKPLIDRGGREFWKVIETQCSFVTFLYQ